MATTNSIDTTKYVDFNYKGFQSSPSLNEQYPFLLTGITAVKNVIKMYLMSQRGDYGRNIIKGGPLMVLVGKALNAANEQNVKDILTEALAIYQNIIIISMSVQQDLLNKAWLVNIVFSDTYNKFVDSINLSVTQSQG